MIFRRSRHVHPEVTGDELADHYLEKPFVAGWVERGAFDEEPPSRGLLTRCIGCRRWTRGGTRRTYKGSNGTDEPPTCRERIFMIPCWSGDGLRSSYA
jgi:hypothetical protein